VFCSLGINCHTCLFFLSLCSNFCCISSKNKTDIDLYNNSDSSCQLYEEYPTSDQKWITAKAFSIIAVSLGSIGIVVSCAALRIPCFLKWSTFIFLLVSASQSFIFFFLGSSGCLGAPDVDPYNTSSTIGCYRSSSGNVGIAAAVMWGLCFVFTFFIYVCKGIRDYHAPIEEALHQQWVEEFEFEENA
jgi:hypothetical protein